LSWITLSILSSAIFGFVSITDKVLISHYMPSFRSFGAWIGMVTFTVGIVLILAVPASREIDVYYGVVAVCAGLIWGLGLALLFLGMRSQEVSRAISIYFIHPIFVALMASAFLGESLSMLQWGAVTMTVVGTLLVTVQRKPGIGRLELNRSNTLILAAAAFTAGAQLVSKHALSGVGIWEFYPYWYIGLSIPFLVLVNSATLREVRECLSRSSTAAWMIVGEGILGSLAAWITLAAIQAGPVSLVIAIAGTRPIFVFLFSTFLSLRWWDLLDEPIHRGILIYKAFSILLIVVGIAIISTLSAT